MTIIIYLYLTLLLFDTHIVISIYLFQYFTSIDICLRYPIPMYNEHLVNKNIARDQKNIDKQ